LREGDATVLLARTFGVSREQDARRSASRHGSAAIGAVFFANFRNRRVPYSNE